MVSRWNGKAEQVQFQAFRSTVFDVWCLPTYSNMLKTGRPLPFFSQCLRPVSTVHRVLCTLALPTTGRFLKAAYVICLSLSKPVFEEVFNMILRNAHPKQKSQVDLSPQILQVYGQSTSTSSSRSGFARHPRANIWGARICRCRKSLAIARHHDLAKQTIRS